MNNTVARRRPPDGKPVVAPPSFGVLLLLLATALLVNTGVGPLGLTLVEYPLSETLRNQLIGLELVTLTLVVPWCVVAGLRALRHRPDAALVAFGPTAYTCYMFVQYVLGPEYLEYRAVTLFHVGLVGLSGALTLWAWSLSRHVSLRVRSRKSEKLYAAVMLGLAGFVVLRYAGAIAGAISNADIPQEFADAPTFYWSIYLLDLGVVVPATAAGALALLRGSDIGRRALYAVTGWFALVPPSVAAMAATMLINDDPNSSAATVIVLSIAAVLFGLLAAAVYRRPRRQDKPEVLGLVRSGAASE